MRFFRLVINYTLVLTAALWVYPAFLLFLWIDRKDLPQWTKGKKWFWEVDESPAPIVSPTRLIS